MIHFLRLLASFGLLVILSGCVAFHSLPPRDYATRAQDGVVRLVFDEAGDPWPLDADPAALALLPADLDKARHFRLAQGLSKARAAYDREAIMAEAARRITPGGRVVVLIRGFNNSYGSFRSKFASTREWLGAHGVSGDLRYVEVYWDALHRGGGKVGYPLGLFTRSRSNAGRMAQCGLRDLLARLPAGTDVTLLTHSLGGVAAIDSVVEAPKGWANLRCTGRKGVPSVPLQLGDVRIAAFAPAVGGKQLGLGKDHIDPARFAGLDRLYVAWDRNDPAVTKKGKGLNLPDTMGGDTRLGGNPGFVSRIALAFARGGAGKLFQPLEFSQPSHELATYLADRDKAACVLWAAKLLLNRPPACTLEQ